MTSTPHTPSNGSSPRPERFTIRDLRPTELETLGRLMVGVYSSLEGFPTPQEQPRYYDLLANIGQFAEKPGVRVLVAVSDDGSVMGGVVYFADMAEYGSGGISFTIPQASGIRLLGVDPRCRGAGVGKALTNACIELARAAGHREVILHTTAPMRVAWQMYERLGFVRAEELDFLQEGFPVRGFRLRLQADE
jgi:GNAT superfamily N-acetyltransferase